MSAARYLGAGLRFLALLCVLGAFLSLSSAVAPWLVDMEHATLFVCLTTGAALVLVVTARLLQTRWRPVARRLAPGDARLVLRRGGLRAAGFGLVAAGTLLSLLGTALRVVLEGPTNVGPGDGHGNQGWVYLLVFHVVLLVLALRATRRGMAPRSAPDVSDRIVTPRGLGLLLVFALGCWMVVSAATGVTVTLATRTEVPRAYTVASLVSEGLLIGIGVVFVVSARRRARTRDVPLGLAAGVLGLALLLTCLRPAAAYAAVLIHGGPLVAWRVALDPGPWSYSLIGAVSHEGAALVIVLCAAAALLAYAYGAAAKISLSRTGA